MFRKFWQDETGGTMKHKTYIVALGFVLGLLFPVVCLSLYAKYRFPDVPLLEIYGHVKKLGIGPALLSLCTFANLAIFFLFLWRQKESIALGILSATFTYAIIVAFVKLQG